MYSILDKISTRDACTVCSFFQICAAAPFMAAEAAYAEADYGEAAYGEAAYYGEAADADTDVAVAYTCTVAIMMTQPS